MQTVNCVRCDKAARTWTGYVQRASERVTAGWCSDRCLRKGPDRGSYAGPWRSEMGLADYEGREIALPTPGTGVAMPDHEPSRVYTSRYLPYCKAQGTPDPDAMLARDRVRYPGGVMAGYSLWIGERWTEWRLTRGLGPGLGPLSDQDHASFGALLDGQE